MRCKVWIHALHLILSNDKEERSIFGMPSDEMAGDAKGCVLIPKGGDDMPTGLEVIKAALDDFKKIQRYMMLAKKENAKETYAELKEEYLTLKAILQVAGVNLTGIDKMQE